MLAAATLVTALARPGLANLSNDAAAASELFRQGLSDMLAGRYETACPRLEESQHLDPQLGTLFTLAECSAKAEKIASAVAYYEDFLAATKKLPKASVLAYERRIRIAESQCAALKSDIPWLTLIFPDDAPPGTVVKKDGIVLGPAAIGIALPIDPGQHVIVTEAAQGGAVETRISIERGEKKQLLLQLGRSEESRGVQAATPGAENPAKTASPLPPANAPMPPQFSTTPPPHFGHPNQETSTTRTWNLGLALAGASAFVGGGASLFVGTRKVLAINHDSADGKPYDPANGNYRDYQTVGVTLMVVGSAAMITAGVLAWRRPATHDAHQASLSIAPMVSPQFAGMLLQVR